MAHRVSLERPIMAIGGLALNVGVVRCLEELLKETMIVPTQPQIVSATGAAVIASRTGATA